MFLFSMTIQNSINELDGRERKSDDWNSVGGRRHTRQDNRIVVNSFHLLVATEQQTRRTDFFTTQPYKTSRSLSSTIHHSSISFSPSPPSPLPTSSAATMNTIAIAFVCAILIGKSPLLSSPLHRRSSSLRLVTQQAVSAINCYSCGTGTDGCSNTGFSKTGHGVLATTDNTAAYCYVSVPIRPICSTLFFSP